MRIRELRTKAREDAQGNKWALMLPMFITTVVIYLIGLLPNLLEAQTGKLVLGILVFVATLFFTVAASYAVMIRTLRVARKEEKTNFFADVFGEGMRNGWSCAWGIFKKIWYWIILLVVGYALLFGGVISAMGIENLESISEEVAPNVEYSTTALILVLVGFVLIILAAIKVMVASYKYFLVTYLKHDYPDRSTNELLEKSKEMMDGNKAKAFVIPLTFIGWLLLAAICAGVVRYVFNLIWPPYSLFGVTVPTMPIWTEILMTVIVYFITSFVTAYMQMTYCEFYLERNPLEIYNEDYVKPETNAKKYKAIIGWVYGIIVALMLILPIALGGLLYNMAGNMTSDLESMIEEMQNELQNDSYDWGSYTD